MKLQSLKSSRFKAFEKNVVSDLIAIVGGSKSAISNSSGTSGNRHDCADPTGAVGTSGGSWDNVSWHSGLADYLGVGVPCAQLPTRNVYIDPTTMQPVVTTEDKLSFTRNRNKIRF